jgi:2-polyprenyl-6-methoxyphenol hydroxylase-like FAD-dependent oxidoreductase
MDQRTVLISGAGIGGPTLAFWLKVAGFEPVLIEHAPRLRTGGYVVDFWGIGYDIAERMGLAGDLHRIGYHIREMRIVGARGERIAGFGASVFQELIGRRFVTLRRSDLSRLLFEKIKGAVAVIFGNEIVGLREHPDFVQVQFKDGSERQFALVIGADGLHSNVRGLTFGPQDRFEKQLGYAVAAFEVQGYRPRDEDVYMLYNEPSRMVGRFALHDDRTLFLFVFTAATDTLSIPLDLAAQKGILQERFGGGKWECARILCELDRTPELYFDRVSQIRLECWSRGRVALLGDAAFCVSLVAGQGSALAMTAAYVLAGELARADGRHEDAFGKYEALLRPYVASKQRGAERFAAAFAPKTQWGLRLRNQVIKACAIPGLATLAFGRDIVDALQLPDYGWPALPSTGS